MAFGVLGLKGTRLFVVIPKRKASPCLAPCSVPGWVGVSRAIAVDLAVWGEASWMGGWANSAAQPRRSRGAGPRGVPSPDETGVIKSQLKSKALALILHFGLFLVCC